MRRWDELQGALVCRRRRPIAGPKPPAGGARPICFHGGVAALALAEAIPRNEVPGLGDGDATIALARIRKLSIGERPQRPCERQVRGSESLWTGRGAGLGEPAIVG